MKKTIICIFISILALTLLSACRNGISKDRLKDDIKSLPSLEGTAQVNEITIIEQIESQEKLEYKLSVLISSLDFTTTADISLTYSIVDGKYVLTQNTVDIVEAEPNQSQQIYSKYSEAIREISNNFFYHYSGDSNQDSVKSTLTLVSAHLTSDQLSGTGTIVISESFKDDIFAADALYTLQATYNSGSGWTYELIDWGYHDTTSWSGVYDIHWTQEVPGYPAGGLNSFYKLNKDLLNIQISGECSITRRMNQTENDLVENTLQISFDYNGTHLDDQPKIYGSSNELFFEFPSNPDTLIIFQYQPYIRVNELNQAGNNFYIGVPYLDGILTRRPN